MRALSLAVLAALIAACAGPSAGGNDNRDRDRFGYRVGSDPDRETVLLRPVTDSTRYLLYPAVVDSIGVRPAGRPAAGDAVAVEVLIQGALPDACAELTGVQQQREGQYVTVQLLMRQPRETVCAAVVRPFRFYLMLDEPYEVGSYVLTLNGTVKPFQVLPALAPAASPAAGGDAG